MPTEVPHAVYRLFSAEDVLLYIGMSKNFGRRWMQEAAEKPWWPEVKRQTVEWYDSQDEAAAAETAAIGVEHPVHNLRGLPAHLRRVPPRPEFPPPPEWSDDDRARIIDRIREVVTQPDVSHAEARLIVATLLTTGNANLPCGGELDLLARSCGVSRAHAFRARAEATRRAAMAAV